MYCHVPCSTLQVKRREGIARSDREYASLVVCQPAFLRHDPSGSYRNAQQSPRFAPGYWDAWHLSWIHRRSSCSGSSELRTLLPLRTCPMRVEREPLGSAGGTRPLGPAAACNIKAECHNRQTQTTVRERTGPCQRSCGGALIISPRSVGTSPGGS